MVSSMQGVCRITFIALPALVLQIASPGAIAQGYADYPSRPVSIIVPFEGNSVSEILERYMQRSEQVPTRLWLAADGQRVLGVAFRPVEHDVSPEEADDP